MVENIFLILGFISIICYFERMRAHANFPSTDEAQHTLTQAYQLRLSALLTGGFTSILFLTELGHLFGVGGLEFLMGQQNLGITMGIICPLLSNFSIKFDQKILANYAKETKRYEEEVETVYQQRGLIRRTIEGLRTTSVRVRDESKYLQDGFEKDQYEAEQLEKQGRKEKAERDRIAADASKAKEDKNRLEMENLSLSAQKALAKEELAQDTKESKILQRQIKSHIAAIAKMEMERSDMLSEIQDLYYHFNKLSDTSKEKKKQLDESNKAFEELKIDITKMGEEIQVLEREITHGEEQSQNLQGKEADAKKELNKLKRKETKLSKMLENYRKLLAGINETELENVAGEAKKKFLAEKAAEEAIASSEEQDNSGLYEG